MLLGDSKHQLPVDSLPSIPIDLSNALIRRDEFSEIVTNMTKTLHVNTPEQTLNNVNIDELDDDDEKRQELIEQLKTQLTQNQMKRTQARNYIRILNQSNTPAYWYKTPSTNRSVYFYDPNYQKYLQQRTNSPPRIKPNISTNSPPSLRNRTRVQPARNNWFSITPRTKYMLDIYTTAVSYHRQKQRSNLNHHITPSDVSEQRVSTAAHIKSLSVLPPINMTTQRKEHHLSNIYGTNHRQTLLTELRKK